MPEESITSKKNSSPSGFSLANIRILPDSGQLRGHANHEWMPQNRLFTTRPLQAKLAINRPGDRYEQEADRVAEQVMRMPDPRIVNRSEMAQPPLMRRSCPKCKKKASEREDDEELLQKKPLSIPASHFVQPSPSSVPPIVHEVLRSSGRPLDPATRAFMEPRFGHDFSRVRVHEGARAAESARAVNALAYTVGNDIILGAGRYAPEKTIGKQLLAHELTHTIQQSEDNLLQEDHGPLMACRPVDSYEIKAETQALSADNEDMFVPICVQGHIGIKRKQTSLQRIDLESIEVPGVACPCDPATEQNYDYETFRYITSIEPLITSIATRRNVPATTVAGAIADEYNGRRGLRAHLDDIQDALIGSLPEFSIDIDRFFDFHARLLNTLENDVGRANINVRTALQLVQSGELTVPGSPPSDIQVNRIIDYLLTERGMVEATAAVIARALRLFSPYLGEHGEELREAIFVEYFKQGDRYFNRFLGSLAHDPTHKVCPGEGGCRYLFNRDRILTALHPLGIQLQFDVGTMAPHVTRGDR
jgi:hypothetical protein